MRQLTILSLGFMALFGIGYFLNPKSHASNSSDDGNNSNKKELAAYYKRLLADPKTGEIPFNIRKKELDYAAGLPVFYGVKRGEDIWKSRGPLNQGGRTRGFEYNVNNVNEILAGSATGGIWKSKNAGQTWQKTKCPVNAITCIIQDRRPGKTQTWYAGTGELSGSSGSGGGAYYCGNGILKSIDGGDTWEILTSTQGNSPTAFDSDFDGIWNLVIDPSNVNEDEIYAATYGGIYKSLDGGISWKKKRSGSLPNASYYTDVAITDEGVVYATMSSESTHRGFWRSADGETWVNILPPGFGGVYGRTCIGIVPSDQTQVYFVSTGTNNFGHVSYNFLGVAEWNSLWKYDYVSGDGSGTGGRWHNRSQKLPAKGGDFGYYNTQGGYDLYIRILPNDTNTVFIGCTNLWRSTDGFKTDTKTDWIGGYAVNTSRPDFQLYPNHHPDNHHLVFLPGHPQKAYSAHDGGISFTNNILAPQVEWEFKTLGYLTSQFYTIALDHASNGNKLIGGLQDNGTLFTDVYGEAFWHMTYNGDGSYCSFKNGTNEVYASAQQGRIAHIEYDAIGKAIKYARIDPAQLYRNNYDFINPFVLDPYDQKIMYLPAKNRLFRNLNIDAKAMSTTFDSSRWDTPLWVELTNCVPLNGHEFSAIQISKSNPNTLFYATDKGKLYRVRNAHVGQPQPEDITGTSFSFGNINCIALDPLDSNHIGVVFSNYNVISVFNSNDGGKTWNNISGNLEENPNGSGSGPSCRWISILTLANGTKCWFVATSVGLFASDSVNGIQTRWIKQSPNGIGDNIVTMIDCRQEDYALAVATHGHGVFTAHIASPWQITRLPETRAKPSFSVYPNPLTGRKLHVLSQEPIHSDQSIELFDVQGKRYPIISIINSGSNHPELQLPELPVGIYFLAITYSHGQVIQKVYVNPI